MSAPKIDPAFAAYVREEPKISYVQPDDPWLTRHLISAIEHAFGRKHIEKIYKNLKEGPFDNIHIPPSPGDAGSAVGCAQYLYHIIHFPQKVIA